MKLPDTALLEVRLLGSVEALRGGEALPVGGPKQRALLALLVLERGRPVSDARLVDELWPGEPPSGAGTTLRSYVTRLRRALGQSAPIARVDAGYAIDLPPDVVDVFRFDRLLREGEDALARGAFKRAVERLTNALELWRGRPFGDLAEDTTLRVEADRLEALRLRAVEARFEAQLGTGKAEELVDEIEATLRSQPYRERLWRYLMLALYRAGRQADAISAYRRARKLFADELGLEPSPQLRRLEKDILRHEVEASSPPEARQNLPASLSSFVGRELELEEVDRLIRRERLVTLTGVGGAGKTRLALEAARRLVSDFPDGIWFVDLSAVAEPGLVAGEVGAALELRQDSDTDPVAQLRARLRNADLLLVIDNCEHLREECAELAETILAGCPRVHVLATSREPLGAPGESTYPVPPLALPRAGAGVDELRTSEAVLLFVERARRARPTLRDDDRALETAARICSDLDGLPLAIELAAARTRALSLDEIAGRLHDRFRFLVSWRRVAIARHRTLREAMDWSYELLAPDEQALLCQLSVFAGSFGLDAVATVCVSGDEALALDLVERLLDASLVVVEEDEHGTRYRMLETVRQYGAERLEDVDGAPVRDRHSDWCLALAEEAQPELMGAKQALWLQRLELERENFAAALAYLASVGDAERRLRLAIALSRFWYVHGHLAEGRRRLEEALAAGEPADGSLLRKGLTAAASLALLQGDHARAIPYAERALELALADGDRVYVANSLSNLGAIVLAGGDHDRASELLEEAVSIAREADDLRVAALAINNLGDLALTLGEYERAEPLFEESLDLLRMRGDTANIARSLFNLSAVALELGRVDDAETRLGESVEFAQQAGDKEDLAWCLEGVAGVAAARGDGERAAVLLGRSGALLAEMGADFKPFERRLHQRTYARALELCGEAVFSDATGKGAALTTEAALTWASPGPDRV